jgi:hypothetical protein
MINWNYLDVVYGFLYKYIHLSFIVIFMLLNFSSQIANPRINVYGHLGGLLVGFFTVFVLLKPVQEGDGVCCNYKYWNIASWIILGLSTVTEFLCFYLLDNYK